MKTKFLIMMELFSFIMLTSCSSDNDIAISNGSSEYENKEESPQMNNVEELVDNVMNFNLPYKEMTLEDMPSWLADMITESIEISKTFPISSWYYQFNWNESTYYLIRGTYTTSLFDVLFNSQGEKIELSLDEQDNCLTWSSDWCIIYEVQSESYK